MSDFAAYLPSQYSNVIPSFSDLITSANQQVDAMENAELENLANTMLQQLQLSSNSPSADIDPTKKRTATFLLDGVVASLPKELTTTDQTTPTSTTTTDLTTLQTASTNPYKKEDLASKSTNMTITPDEKAKYEKMSLEDLLAEDADLGNTIRITCGYRGPKSKVGKAGSRSWHAHKDSYGHSKAYDIVPKHMGFTEFKQKLKASVSFQKWLVAHNFNINDETIPSVMAKTGATGKHFHLAPEHFSLLDLTKVKKGGVLKHSNIIKDRQGGLLDMRVNKLKNLRYGWNI